MITTKSNGYTMSRDFPDGVLRLRVVDIVPRVPVIVDSGDMRRFIAITIKFTLLDREDEPITVDGQTWLTELAVYGMLKELLRCTSASTGPKLCAVSKQCIQAFVTKRRGTSKRADECITPGDEVMRDDSEIGMIWMTICMFNKYDAGPPLSEVLRRVIARFDLDAAWHVSVSERKPALRLV